MTTHRLKLPGPAQINPGDTVTFESAGGDIDVYEVEVSPSDENRCLLCSLNQQEDRCLALEGCAAYFREDKKPLFVKWTERITDEE